MTRPIFVASGGAALAVTLLGSSGVAGQRLSDLLLLIGAGIALLLARDGRE